MVETRKGGGTRVADGASPLPTPVVVSLRELVAAADRAGVGVDELQSALAAIWTESR